MKGGAVIFAYRGSRGDGGGGQGAGTFWCCLGEIEDRENEGRDVACAMSVVKDLAANARCAKMITNTLPSTIARLLEEVSGRKMTWRPPRSWATCSRVC